MTDMGKTVGQPSKIVEQCYLLNYAMLEEMVFHISKRLALCDKV